MSTWSLTGVDMTAGLAVTSCSRRVLYLWAFVSSSRATPLSVHLNDSDLALGGL